MKCADHLPDRGGRERRLLETLDAAHPGPLGDLATQRMPPVQVLAAIAEHPCHAIGEWSRDQEADQVAGGLVGPVHVLDDEQERSEEHTSELQSLMRISYAVFCLKKKKYNKNNTNT